MNRFLKEIIVMLLLFFGFNQFLMSQEKYVTISDIAGFKKKLLSASQNTKTIECDFVLEKNMSMLTKKVVSKGHFCCKKPGFIRWEYVDPYNYLIIINKKKVFVKDDGRKKQYDSQSNKMFKELGSMMFSFVQGDIAACEKDYKIDYFVISTRYYVKMIPKTSKLLSVLAEVDLYFDKNDYSVAKVNMIEPGGDYTNLEFVNKKLNQEISNEKFSFK